MKKKTIHKNGAFKKKPVCTFTSDTQLCMAEAILFTLAEIQIQIGCAPIEVQIGSRKYLDESVFCNAVICKAPPIVVDELIRRGWSLDIRRDGVYVYKLPFSRI